MKKLLYIVPVIMLLAASCNSQTTIQPSQTSPSPSPTTQAPAPTSSPTPAATSTNKIYTNTDYGFKISYPSNSSLFSNENGNLTPAVLDQTYSYLGRFSGDVVFISLEVPKNTGISRADVLVSYSDTPSPDPSNPSNIQYSFTAVDKSQGVPPPTIATLNLGKTVVINGITWGYARKTGAAAGTISDVRVYHTYHNNLWYEVETNLWDQTVMANGKAPDKTQVEQQLQDILSSFKFTK